MRNDNIRERLKVENITERSRKARLRWFGHVKRRDQEYVGRKTLGDGTTWEKKTEAAVDGWMDGWMDQLKLESYRDNKR